MAEPLTNHYGPEIPRRIAAMLAAVHPAFDSDTFLRGFLDGCAARELCTIKWVARGSGQVR